MSSFEGRRFHVLLLASAMLTSGVHLTAQPSNDQTSNTHNLSLADLFPADRVIDIQVTVDEKDWDTIRYQTRNLFEVLQEKRKYKPIESPYTYVPASVTIDGIPFPKVGLRKKGFIGSLSSTRPSLKIKLNYVDKQSSIEGVTNLTLNNNKQDPTLVNQYMAYSIFQAAGSPAPRCSFARVTVNGTNLGVYSHVETVRESMIHRTIGNDDGTLFEGTVVDFHDGWEKSFERKFGKDKTARKQIEKLITALKLETDSPNFEEVIGKLVDLDSFYTFWAVEGLIGFWDGYSGNNNNFFVYYNQATEKFHFLPWGADAVFAKYSKIAYDQDAPISVKTKGLLAYKLYQLESGRKRYASTLGKLLKDHWDESTLLKETDRIEALIGPHLAPSQSGFGQSLNQVREFIRTRRADLVAEISDGMPLWAKSPDPPIVIPTSFGGGEGDSIWNAAKTGDVAAIQKHLDNDVDVNARDISGTTPLSMAALAGQSDATAFLLAKGANVNTRNNDSQTPMHGAAFLGHLDVVKVLLEHKADINIRNKDGDTPLDAASAAWNDEIQGLVQFVVAILRVKLDIDDVRAGRPKVMVYLRNQGAKSGAGMPTLLGSNLWESSKLGNIDGLKKHLAKKGVNANAHDDKGITPLCWAAMAGRVEAADYLIKHGANVNERNRDGGSALHAAAFLGRVQVVELLIKNKADINAKNGMGETPYGSVSAPWSDAIEGIIKFVAGFLKIRVDVEQVKQSRPKIVELLRANGGKTGAELR